MDDLLAALTNMYGDQAIPDPRLMAPMVQPQMLPPQMGQPQQPAQGSDYLKQLLGEMRNQIEQNASRMAPVVSLLSQRFQPTMDDAARSVTQNVQAYAPGSGIKPMTMQDATMSRVSNELAPYTTLLDMNEKVAKSNYLTSGGNIPAAIKEWQYYNQLPEDQKNNYLKMKRADQIMNLGGTYAVRSPSGGITEQYPVTLKPSETPEVKGQQTKAEATAKTEAERQGNLSKASAALAGFEQQANLVVDQVDKAIKTISPLSTGYGSYLSGIPNTDAGKLNNYLTTIKANVGFDKLQDMRANSPTGGALGQVSDLENRLLQAVNGALDPKQSDVLKENLESIKALYPKVLAEKKKAFQSDYGQFVQPDGIKLDENAPPPLETPSQNVQKWGRDAQGKPVRLQ